VAASNADSPVAIDADLTRKLVRIHFRRIVKAEHMSAASRELKELLSKVGRGFILLTDLTGLEEMDLECVPHVTRNMDLCLAAGVGTIIRVIPEPQKDIGFRLLSLTHYRGRVPILSFDSMAEAEKAMQAPAEPDTSSKR
jgi:hypothetical protein